MLTNLLRVDVLMLKVIFLLARRKMPRNRTLRVEVRLLVARCMGRVWVGRDRSKVCFRLLVSIR